MRRRRRRGRERRNRERMRKMNEVCKMRKNKINRFSLSLIL